MVNPTGSIVSLVDSDVGVSAVVAVEVASACPRCAAGNGCGAGLMAGTGAKRQVEARVRDGLVVAVDDVVEISLAPDNLLRAAVIVYGSPMLGAAIGALIAFWLSLGDGASAIATLLGLGFGLVVSRWQLRQASCLSRFVPTIERHV